MTEVLKAIVPMVLLVAYVRLCRWVHRRFPGSLADRIRAAIAAE